MIFLDTDHLTLLKYPASPRFTSLVARMEASPDQEIGTTIVSVEEQSAVGWLSSPGLVTLLATLLPIVSSGNCSLLCKSGPSSPLMSLQQASFPDFAVRVCASARWT